MELSAMNKLALRNACKANKISYGGMSNDQMRAALQAVVDAQLAAVAAEQQAELDAAADAALQAEAAEREVQLFRSIPNGVLETNEGETGFTLQTDEGPVWHPIPLTSLGEYGLGIDAESSRCPHCGVDHRDNGFCTRDDEVANKPGVTCHMEGMNEKYECLGCTGRWGDVAAPYTPPKASKGVKAGTGLKIEKNRVERNGIKQPSLGGACRSVWDACTEMQGLQDTPLTVKQVKEHAATMQWNVNNAVIEFYRWKKWSAPTADEVQAAPAATPAPEAPEAPEATE